MNTPELLLIGGKPYSGKSTIARAFVESEEGLRIRHLSMGERLRGIGKGEIPSRFANDLQQSEAELKAHAPVPRHIPLAVFEEFIEESPVDLIVVDGFPRYPDQVERFQNMTEGIGTRVLAVCRVEISDSVVHARSASRMARYADVPEDEAFITARLNDFHATTAVALGMLTNIYPCYSIDGTSPIDMSAATVSDIYRAHSL